MPSRRRNHLIVIILLIIYEYRLKCEYQIKQYYNEPVHGNITIKYDYTKHLFLLHYNIRSGQLHTRRNISLTNKNNINKIPILVNLFSDNNNSFSRVCDDRKSKVIIIILLLIVTSIFIVFGRTRTAAGQVKRKNVRYDAGAARNETVDNTRHGDLETTRKIYAKNWNRAN